MQHTQTTQCMPQNNDGELFVLIRLRRSTTLRTQTDYWSHWFGRYNVDLVAAWVTYNVDVRGAHRNIHTQTTWTMTHYDCNQKFWIEKTHIVWHSLEPFRNAGFSSQAGDRAQAISSAGRLFGGSSWRYDGQVSLRSSWDVEQNIILSPLGNKQQKHQWHHAIG